MTYCANNRLILEVKQGENRSFGFTLLQYDENNNTIPIDLTNYTVEFEVRVTPYINTPPVFTKKLTTQPLADGQITEPTQGKFLVYIYSTDIQNLPPQDYYLSIYINNNINRTIISGDGNNSSIIRFCQA